MKKFLLSLFIISLWSWQVYAQVVRTDGVWARGTAGAKITLDGNLNEPVWQKAETIFLKWSQDPGMPTSGWFKEVGAADNPTDPIDATIKFLVVGDSLYIGFDIRDKSIGGSKEWNEYDGLLMHMNQKNLRDPNNHLPTVREAFYCWWSPDWRSDTSKTSYNPGDGPIFGGTNWWADWKYTRPDSMKKRWDAACIVHGRTNDDSKEDTNYTMEMRFNLKELGYSTTATSGDIVEWALSLYDCDYLWPNNPLKRFTGRIWWQCPWSNNDNDVIKIYIRPDVTVNTTTLPTIKQDYTIPNGTTFANPTIDGKLDESIWSKPEVKAFDMKYGDAATIATYPNVGPTRSMWERNYGTTSIIADPMNATVKWFFKNNWLYIGVDVKDKFVQDYNNGDREDGVILSIFDRGTKDPDNHNLKPISLHIKVDSTGKAGYLDDLKKYIDSGWVKANISLKSGTTVNKNDDIDAGYTVEYAIDLTKFGYPASRGDGIAFLGLGINDGDSFDTPADNYGTRTSWFKFWASQASPAWCYMDPMAIVYGGTDKVSSTRNDGVWARSTAGSTITLDGNMNEPAWDKAETVYLKWAQDAGMPTSGWFKEVGVNDIPTDPIDAKMKFLVNGDKLYIGFDIKDKSIGGSKEWNEYDGLLMHMNQKNMRDPNNHLPTVREAFYCWWSPDWRSDTSKTSFKPGDGPIFGGTNWWADFKYTRPDSMKNRWDAACLVHGRTNDDAVEDTNYTIEMMFNLKELGYNATDVKGDIVEWAVSLYDCDYLWPNDAAKRFTSRVWWQSPWSNNDNNVIKIYVRPDVTINSGDVPVITPDYAIPNASGFTVPKIDGKLDEAIWSKTETKAFDMKYGDATTLATYPNVGPTRSMWERNYGTTNIIGDPANATARWFFKDNWLYIGVDVKDKFVQDYNNGDREDGLILSFFDRAVKDPDNHNLKPYSLHVKVDSTGKAAYMDDLKKLVDTGWVKVGLALKSGTTVNKNDDVDQGYTVEFAIDLTKFGYPTNRGDGIAFLGLGMNDGDSFDTPTDNYGTRTSWFKFWATQASPAWCYLDPTIVISGGDAGGNWVKQTSPVTSILRIVKAIDDNTAWASGSSGVVLRTTDGGVNWVKLTSPDATCAFYGMDAIDANTAWVYGTVGSAGTKIYKTTDGGNTWTKQYEETKSYGDALHFFNANDGVAIGDPDDGANAWFIITTSDGGKTWNRVDASKYPAANGEAGAADGFASYGNNMWFTAYSTGTSSIYRSTDKGLSWKSSSTGLDIGSNAYVDFKDANNGIIGNISGNIAKTTDGGATWSAPVLVDATGIRTAAYIPGSNAIVLGGGGAAAGVVYTQNSPTASWVKNTLPASNPRVRFLDFSSAANGWGVGESGGIIRWTGGSIVSVKKLDNVVPSVYSLSQNYPNPFNPSTNIIYSIPQNSKVTLKIYNSLGQEVRTLVDEVQTAGKYTVNFNASHFASGVYFYQLRSDNFTDVKKMMLIK